MEPVLGGGSFTASLTTADLTVARCSCGGVTCAARTCTRAVWMEHKQWRLDCQSTPFLVRVYMCGNFGNLHARSVRCQCVRPDAAAPVT